MNRPEDIPQDVWDAMMALMDRHLYGKVSAQEAIARAIMAAKAEERSSCLKLAIDTAAAKAREIRAQSSLPLGSGDTVAVSLDTLASGCIEAGTAIASAIRSRT